MSASPQNPNTETLAMLIRYGNTLLQNGDEFGPLAEEARRHVAEAVAGWRQRYMDQHLGPVAEHVTFAKLFDLAMMADGLIVAGDGIDSPALGNADLVRSFTFRQAVLARAASAPNGSVTATILNRSPVAGAAWRKATDARAKLAPQGTAASGGALPPALAPLAPPAAPPAPPAPPAPASSPDAFRFGPGPDAPAPLPPDPKPPEIRPDPPMPVPASPAEPGSQEAAA